MRFVQFLFFKHALEKILEEIEKRVDYRKALVRYEKKMGTITDVARNQGALEEIVIIAKIIDSSINDGWIPVEERLPEDCEEIVLVQVSGKPADNILFDNAFEFALYEKEEGWMLDNYPEWKNPDVIAWQSLPKPYRQPKKEKSSCKEHIMSRFMKVE